MATAAVPNRDTAFRVCAPSDDPHGWGLVLLLAAVAVLFLRPAELLPALADWPIYQFLIVCCLVVSARAIGGQLTQQKLREQIVTACLLILLLSVGVSHLSHGFFWGARMSTYAVTKVVALYLLIVGLVNTPQRLKLFVRWLTLAITVVATLALLDHSAIIDIAALEPVFSHGKGPEAELVERIRGTGIFQDPNDFGLILVTGLTFSASFLLTPHIGWPRYLWLGPGIVLLVTLILTHSRGALISVACVFPAVVAYRGGWKWGAFFLLCLPLFAIVFSSRMSDFTAIEEGTGQSRIQAWSEGLTIFRQYPIFGLGQGLLVEENGMVTHNSFLQCYAELGMVGGTTFLACFLAAGLNLWSVRDEYMHPAVPDRIPRELQELAHMRVFVFAALVAYSAGMLTLSRQFVAPTYLILGLAAATKSLHASAACTWRLGRKFLTIALVASAGLLLAAQVIVRLFVHW